MSSMEGNAMDYMDIVKRAWRVTWRYKILWLFGLFAGAGTSFSGSGGSSGGGSGTGTGTGSQSAQAFFQQAQRFVERNLALIIALGVFLFLLGIVWWVLSIAARGGIVKLVDDAEEGRPVLAGDGWRVGFSNWLKVFAVSFLAELPALALGIVMVVVILVAVLGAGVAGILQRGDTAALSAVVVSSLAGTCLFLVVFGVLAIAFGIVFGIVRELAVRYAVLEGRGVIDSLKTAWSDLWAKRGAFMMFLTVAVVGLVVGIVLGIMAVAVIVPGVLLIAFGGLGPGALVVILGGIVLMAAGAVYGALYHSLWTVFFRRMTGREKLQSAAAAAASSVAQFGSAAFPPPPPSAPAPAADPWSAAHSVPEPPVQEPQAPSPTDAAPPEA
jgi:hypothetical protein